MSDLRNQIFKNFAPYTPGEQPTESDWIKLNTNENAYLPSEKVLHSLQYLTENPEKLKKYPHPFGEPLRTEVSKNFDIDPSNVLITNGSDEALSLICKIFLDKGDLAAMPEITYSLYDTLIKAAGGSTYLAPMENGTLSFNPENLENSHAKIVFLPNPNANTGEYFDINKLANLIGSSKKLWILDEAYNDFVNSKPSSFLSIIKNFNNVIIVRTFSKSYALAGMRIGYIICMNNLYMDTFRAVKDSYNEDIASLYIGVAALQDRTWFNETVKKIQESRKALVRRLTELNFNVFPSEANFIVVEPPHPFEAVNLLNQLKEKKILVRYFNTPLLKKYLRITIGTEEENSVLLNELKKLVK